jgi:arogenate/prephenate dehydratase
VAAVPGGDPLPCASFEVAFQALSQWVADAAVLPIENSLGGSIHAVYDLLLRHDSVSIVGEVAVRVRHCLVARPGTALADVTSVASHPQALAQCDGYLRSLGVARVAADDTAGAAADLATAPPGAAALASERAASLYGLDVLARDVQDDPDNVTRFLVLARDAGRPSPADPRPHKTSLVFSLPDGAGQLFKALSVFALRDIDMTKIESRPARDSPLSPLDAATAAGGGGRRFNYLFYLDVAANAADPRAQAALRHLAEIAPLCRVLGCYPAGGEAVSSVEGGAAAAAVVGGAAATAAAGATEAAGAGSAAEAVKLAPVGPAWSGT